MCGRTKVLKLNFEKGKQLTTELLILLKSNNKNYEINNDHYLHYGASSERDGAFDVGGGKEQDTQGNSPLGVYMEIMRRFP